MTNYDDDDYGDDGSMGMVMVSGESLTVTLPRYHRSSSYERTYCDEYEDIS
jgi:hypothetical protein